MNYRIPREFMSEEEKKKSEQFKKSANNSWMKMRRDSNGRFVKCVKDK